MDPAQLAHDPDEARRLIECAREPIRTPGTIQGHGTLMGIDRTGVISVVSENARRWLGHSVREIGNDELEFAVRTGRAIDPVRITWDDRPCDAIVHRADKLTIVELEQVEEGNEYARTAVVGAIQHLSTVDSISGLRRESAALIRRVTGFDRVMIYHFHDDGHGEIVADDHASWLDPYLGLHFPSSDIPPQARALYLTKVGRTIADTTTPGIPLLTLTEDAGAIDLSNAELRSVSPHHLQFMRNMGQASTFSLSLIEEGRLVGMITCAHGTPRRLPVLLRRALEVLAGQISMQLASMREIERLRHLVTVRERRAELLAPLYASDDLHSALLGGRHTVLDLVPADGVLVRIDGVTRVSGETPPIGNALHAIDAIGLERWATECLSEDRPDLTPFLPEVAGLLLVPLGEKGDIVVFFRREAVHDISWLGDPGIANRSGVLSPRTSFAAWQRTVRARSAPWGTVIEEAADLGHELEIALQRRAEAQLAELAMRDALTGLFNRRYLVDRLETFGPVGPAGKAVLFVDLDDFKSVNDRYGHDAGDRVILDVARRLVEHSREQDVVIRLGGDEFVVLLDGVIGEDVAAIAQRMVDAVALPIVVGDALITLTASCGIVVAAPGASRRGLLEAADEAMYRAKNAGRNRVSR